MRKIYLLIGVILFLFCSVSFGEEVRRPAVAGAFYPGNKEELKRVIESYLEKAKTLDIEGKIIGIMVPHAGYAYSGQVAGEVYAQLKGKDIKRAIIICNSHSSYFEGIALDNHDKWNTPLGELAVDKDFASRLTQDGVISFRKEEHLRDHTIEVQAPFLQVLFGSGIKIVPALFGNSGGESYKILAQLLASNMEKGDIVVASTDMSHYPSYEDAYRIDNVTLELVAKKDIGALEEHIASIKDKNVKNEETLCCGIDGVKTLMELSNMLGANASVIGYANSGDAPIGDRSKVVGYGGVIFYMPDHKAIMEDGPMKEEYLSKDEKRKLINIAKASIIEAVTKKKGPTLEVKETKLLEKSGAFVTIKEHGELRGCIGYIIAVKPLYETVKEVAKAAAVNDYRFIPLSQNELKDITLEISVLTPLKKIASIDEIEVGRHGLMMKNSFNSGLLLPQVATEYGWDKETFLQQTCIKAGIPKDAWKDNATEIYTFSAEVFNEDEIK